MRLLTCAFLVLAAPSALAQDCTTAAEAAALKITAMRQQLIAAALFCGEGEAYHRFATGFRGDLRNADTDVNAFFARHRLSGGADAFKARAAKLSDQERARDGAAFCADAHTLLAAANAYRGHLAGLVARTRADTGSLCKAVPFRQTAPQLPLAKALPPVLPTPRPQPVLAAWMQPTPSDPMLVPRPEPLRARRIAPAITPVTLATPQLPEELAPPDIRQADAGPARDDDETQRSWRAWDRAHRGDWQAVDMPAPPPSGWYPWGWYPPPAYYSRW